MDSEESLDVSWIEQEERIQNIEKNYFREPMENIDLFFIYINQNDYINKILCENHSLVTTDPVLGSQIHKEELLKIIQSKKHVTPFSKYRLLEIVSYHVDLEPENIQSFSKIENLEEHKFQFFKKLSAIDDIIISPSIFIFHSINAIYFIFKETEIEIEKRRHTLKSILKTSSVSAEPISTKGTKKVRIEMDEQDKEAQSKKSRLRKTRKNHSIKTI